MSQLHEVLAVEGSLESKAKKLTAETKKTLAKENLFSGQVRQLSHFASEDTHLDNTEVQELTSTVSENLEYTEKAIADFWDATLQKESTNQNAKSDIVIDGKVIAEGVPATFLLGLEKKLTELRSVYESVHTLPPGKNWVPDEQAGKLGIFKTANSVVQFKELKVAKFLVAYEATKEHPAQVHEKNENKQVGKYVTSFQSGLWTPLKKAETLGRIDDLIFAVKKARQRANKEEVVKKNIGSDLFAFING